MKITLLGAGSGFTQPVLSDILLVDEFKEGVIALVDIDPKRLELNAHFIEYVINVLGKRGWRVEASTDRKKVLKGTDYIINVIEVSGIKTVRFDNDIPLKYGIDQCIGDTIGPGGIMKALRTVPVWLEILDDCARLCPRALVMNYTNPMSIMSLASLRSTAQPFIGLCHSVQGTTRAIAHYAGIPYEELVYRCGGINHMAWLTGLTWKGKDLYPRLHRAMRNPEIYEKDPVRFEIMKEFGAFVTESSGHFSEYVPYFRKRADLIKKYCRDGYLGCSGFYASSWPLWRKDADVKRKDILSGKRELRRTRSAEYASRIIEAHATGRPAVVYGSCLNTGLIPNLPHNEVVEVAVTVDKKGFTPGYFGPLPEQLAALCRSNMNVFKLTVDGILSRDREMMIHAMMLDPLSAAVCAPGEIRSMAEELFAAESRFIPRWCRRRGTRSPVRDTGRRIHPTRAQKKAGKQVP